MLHQYEPLHGANDIRLLDIARKKGRLKFELRTTDLTTKPIYEALSYVWGRPVRIKTITESGTRKKLKITRNCFLALYNLCHDGPRTLWVDAVCINQDGDEKPDQLSKMADIYTNGARTVVYLSESDSHWRYFCKHQGKPPMNALANYPYHAGRVLDRPWFSRTWTLQEIILSSDHKIVARVGKQDFDYYHLCEELAQEVGDYYLSVTRESSKLRNLQYSKDLLRMLHETAWAQCSNPLDKLYAISSLFRGELPPGLHVDYRRTKEDLYLRLMIYLLQTGQSAALYDAHGLRGSSALPSWVVDWMELESKFHHSASNPRFLTAGTQESYTKWWRNGLAESGVKLRVSGAVLALAGRRVAQVVSVEPHSRLETLESRCLREGSIEYLGDPMEVDEDQYRDDHEWAMDESILLYSRTWIADHVKAGDCCKVRLERLWRPGFLQRSAKETQTGDYICVFRGLVYPFVLRAVGQEWIMVKTCRLVSVGREEMGELDPRWSSFMAEAVGPLETFVIV